MSNHAAASAGDPQHVLKALMSRRNQSHGNSGLEAYFQKLKAYHYELDFTPPDNPKLSAYNRRHPETAGQITLASSATAFAPPHDAIEKAADISEKKDTEIFGKYHALKEATEALGKKGAIAEGLQEQLSGLTASQIQKLPPQPLFEGLAYLIDAFSKETVSKIAADKRLHPCIYQMLEEYGSDKEGLHIDAREIPQINQSCVRLIQDVCSYALAGEGKLKNGRPFSLEQQYDDAKQEFLSERDRVKDPDHLQRLAHEVNKAALRPQLADWLHELHGVTVKNLANICIADGSSSSVMDTALKSFCAPIKEKGFSFFQKPKKLLLFSECWDGLKAHAELHGSGASVIPGGVSGDALEAYILEHIASKSQTLEQQRTAVQKAISGIVMNIPENPSGRIPSPDEMQKLAAVIVKYDIHPVIVDEVFAAPGYQSLASYPGMADRTYIVGGTSKNLPAGDKIGFGYSANSALAQTVRHALPKEHYTTPTGATGMAALLEHTPHEYFVNNQQGYEERRQLVDHALNKINADHQDPAIEWLHRPDYGCLGTLVFSQKLTEQAGIHDSLELAEYIYKMSGVQTVPVDSQSSKGKIGVRINFSGDEQELIAGLDRMAIAAQFMQEGKQYADIKGERLRGKHAKEHGLPDMLGALMDFLDNIQQQTR